MITIKKKDLLFIGYDDWFRPVYKYEDYYYKDVTLKGDENNIPSVLNCSYNDREGEPDYEVNVVDE
jgi:hypothetical protein